MARRLQHTLERGRILGGHPGEASTPTLVGRVAAQRLADAATASSHETSVTRRRLRRSGP